ncbi:MAG: Xaa-Pro peptidase family protein [Halieaceae bacterium]|jgi:Xaa-Pro dipeptidase|nr:Xaa-Pro peptidase family protein [Halieaceae bacterium]
MGEGIGGGDAAEILADIRLWAHQAPPISGTEYGERYRRVQALMAERGVDALVLGSNPNVRYFTGITWAGGTTDRLFVCIVPREGAPHYVCPLFEEGTLRASWCEEGEPWFWQEHEDPYARFERVLEKLSATRIAVDPGIPFFWGEAMRRAAAGREFIDGSALVDCCRVQKSAAEIALMQQAKDMTLEVHRLTARILAPGISTTEVRAFINDAHRAIGADGSSFCIVLFGEATSYPHGVPYAQRLEEGDTVLIDTGCLVQGYNSDITRTYVYGEASQAVRDVWALEKAAQAAAFDAAVVGASCEAVDAAARRVIEEAGLGPDYEVPGLPHRTGHGIGLSIHEAPYLVRGSEEKLREGMCFSNEPMIVVPGEFGVRLEDHFYMTAEGPRWFTQPSHSIDEPFAMS